MIDQLLKCQNCKRDLAYHLPRNLEEYETKTLIKLLCVRCYCKNNNIPLPVKKGKPIAGVRADVDPIYSFKSALEANFARILNHLDVKWKYENIRYRFLDYKTTPYSYKPDFEIFSETEESLKYGLRKGVYEIKGKIDSGTLKKLRRLKESYPNEYKKLIVVPMSKVKISTVESLGYSCILYTDLKRAFHTTISTWE